MSERCLRQGSVLVPATFDLLRLYSMRFCPFAQRTRLVLAHKNIPHEVVNVNLKYKPAWFLERTPYGLVPVIEYKNQVIYESSICDDFLEEQFPQPSLLSTCPFQRAAHKMLMHDFDKRLVASFYQFLSRDLEKREQGLSAVTSSLHRYNDILQRQKTKYFQGDTCGMVDFHFWPWFERFPAIQQLGGIDLLPSSTFPFLHSWIKNMEQLEAVQKVRYPVEWYAEFTASLARREPDYDIGLDARANL